MSRIKFSLFALLSVCFLLLSVFQSYAVENTGEYEVGLQGYEGSCAEASERQCISISHCEPQYTTETVFFFFEQQVFMGCSQTGNQVVDSSEDVEVSESVDEVLDEGMIEEVQVTTEGNVQGTEPVENNGVGVCSSEYDPVCAQSKWALTPATYINECLALGEGASIFYEGKCRDEVSEGNNPNTLSGNSNDINSGNDVVESEMVVINSASEDDRFFSGGNTASRGDIGIANTNSAEIYRFERWRVENYNIPLANGVYLVELYFAETSPAVDGSGQRLMDISVEGDLKIDNLDVYSEAGGKNRALVKSVGVRVVDGSLDIEFENAGARQPPMINGIGYKLLISNDGSLVGVNDVVENEMVVINSASDNDRFFNGGNIASRGDIGIANTDSAEVYQYERWGVENYAIPLPSGVYLTELYFAETSPDVDGSSQRLMDISVEDDWTINNLDVYSEAGGSNRALVKSQGVIVVDGSLDIKFEKAGARHPPMINGIGYRLLAPLDDSFIEVEDKEEPPVSNSGSSGGSLGGSSSNVPDAVKELCPGAKLLFESETMGWEDKGEPFHRAAGYGDRRASVKSSSDGRYLQIDVKKGVEQKTFAHNFYRWQNDPLDCAVIEYDIYLSPNYDGAATSPKIAGRKGPIGFRGGYGDINNNIQVIGNVDPSNYRSSELNQGFSLTNLWRATKTTPVFYAYSANRYDLGATYNKGSKKLFGKSYGAGTGNLPTIAVKPGEWSRVSFGVKMNDDRKANGRGQIWVDGKKTIDTGNIFMWGYEPSKTGGITAYRVRHMYGGNPDQLLPTQDQYERYRNLKIWGVRQ